MSLQYEHIEITNLSPTKINPSVYSFQALLKADSKDRIGLERMTTDFVSCNFFRTLFWSEFLNLYVNLFIVYISLLPPNPAPPPPRGQDTRK